MRVEITTEDLATGYAAARTILKRFAADVTVNDEPVDLHKARQHEQRLRQQAGRVRRTEAQTGDVVVSVPAAKLKATPK